PLWASTAGGTIYLGDIGSSVQARTVGGNIGVEYVNGPAILDTGGGEIRAGVINGPLTAETAGGDIVLQAASGPVYVTTVGGQIRLGECGNSVRAQSAGGNIQVDGARGGVRAQTAGGNITLLKAMSFVSAQTMAGRILAEIDANRQTFGPSRLETQIGDVNVFIPPALPVTIDAAIGHTMGHRIISDFPIKITGAGGSFGPESGSGQLNGGGHPLDIRTLMGNIQIRKLDPAAIARLEASQKEFWKNWEQFSHQRDATLGQMISVIQMMKLQRRDLQRQLRDLNKQLKDLAGENVDYVGGEQ
ncbi:MAG: hypothetical protein KGM47_08300, partial [Acidobacteriota bacterium]|nr:hypothetical protein [Acidobacteriota bacterium]